MNKKKFITPKTNIKQMNKNQFITQKKSLLHKKTNKTDLTTRVNSKSEQVCSQDSEDTTKKKFN